MKQWGGCLTLNMALLAASACTVRRTISVRPPQAAPPAREASGADLVAQINAQSEAIRTLTATVDLEPTAGSIYSGVIKEYSDVKGFILVEKPAMIHMIGQAPVVRTKIFDMVSDGEDFRLYIPSKQKFIVGKATLGKPGKNALENLRPQHILSALLVPALDLSREKYSREGPEEGGRRYYIITILEPSSEATLNLKRKVWFDRASLEIARLQIYDLEGTLIEDVQYSGYQDFQGVRYPTHIQVSRPIEDYRLSITILKATFNQVIAPEKFELKKPESAELVDLSAATMAKDPHGK